LLGPVRIQKLRRQFRFLLLHGKTEKKKVYLLRLTIRHKSGPATIYVDYWHSIMLIQ